MAQIIDFHAHFVPASLPNVKGRDSRWPVIEQNESDQAVITVDGKVIRKVGSAAWDASTRLEHMATDGIDAQVVSPFHELISPWLPSQDGDALSAAINESVAKLVEEKPNHFYGLGMVPIQDPELAAKRLTDVKAMGLLGVEIPTHVNGMSLADESLDVFFAEAAALDLIVMIHPLKPIGIERAGGQGLAAAVSVPMDAALAAAALIGGGVMARYPELKILLCGGGGAFPYLLPRLDQLWKQIPPITKQLDKAPSEYAASFYYDTAVYDPETLRHLTKIVGDDRIVLGSDSPFLAKQDDPVALVKTALGESRSKVVLKQNAKVLLGLT